MSVVTATDVAANGEARLLPQFERSTKLKGLLRSLLGEVQPTEDVLLQVMSQTGIDTAVGVQLDTLGKLLNVSRGSSDDDEYRTRLYSQISLNSANGTPENIITLVRLVTGSQDVVLNEYFPAEAHVQVRGGNPVPEGFLDLVSPAGVGTFLATAPAAGNVWEPSEVGSPMGVGVLPDVGDATDFVMLELNN